MKHNQPLLQADTEMDENKVNAYFSLGCDILLQVKFIKEEKLMVCCKMKTLEKVYWQTG